MVYHSHWHYQVKLPFLTYPDLVGYWVFKEGTLNLKQVTGVTLGPGRNKHRLDLNLVHPKGRPLGIQASR